MNESVQFSQMSEWINELHPVFWEPNSKASLEGTGGMEFHIQSFGGRWKRSCFQPDLREIGNKGQFVFSPISGMFSLAFPPVWDAHPAT